MKNKKYKIILTIIIILALIIRLIYIIKTPYTEKQHDVEPNGNGLSYIFTIYKTGNLPQDNIGQHYHPPLHQIICTIWLKIISIFSTNTTFLCESLQFVTLIYGMLMLYVIYNITKELKFDNKIQILLMVITAFHPFLIILSGSLNNDGLCILLTLWTILRLIKWYKHENIKNTTILAIITGLCVMAKTSGAIVAIPIMYVFFLRLYKEIKKSKNKVNTLKKYMYLYIFFGCIALPIGLWYPIRNYIEFKQPILYVMDPHNSDLYVGNYSLLERFIPFSNEIGKIYCDPWTNYNIPVFLLKCSLFEEYTWKTGTILNICYYISIVLNLILIIYTIYCIIKNLHTKNKQNQIWKIALFLLFIFNIISYITMNIKLPYGCTMDFRYMVPTLFVGAIFVGFELEKIQRKNKIKGKVLYNIIFVLTCVLVVTANFIILS